MSSRDLKPRWKCYTTSNLINHATISVGGAKIGGIVDQYIALASKLFILNILLGGQEAILKIRLLELQSIRVYHIWESLELSQYSLRIYKESCFWTRFGSNIKNINHK